jgi:hypothetical protein
VGNEKYFLQKKKDCSKVLFPALVMREDLQKKKQELNGL